jgi:aminopeptidase N
MQTSWMNKATTNPDFAAARVSRRWRWLMVASLCCTYPVHAESPYSFDATMGRLPKSIIPLDYTVSLTTDLDKLTLSGVESVRLNFRVASSSIVLDSLNEVLTNVRIDGQPVQSVASDNDQQLTTITLRKSLPAGQHILSFAYSGVIETTPRGLFAQDYQSRDGAKGRLLSTQLEAVDARRMFPCWDEPAFRATFSLAVTAPASLTSVSNMPAQKRIVHGSLATTTFQRSPSMPTYLVELTVGDLSKVSAVHDKTQFTVWTVRGEEANGREALANAQVILSDYNDYFGYRYPLAKLDSIAIPGGFTGAMESWGAITYIDQLLLVGPSGDLNDHQQVFSTQAHEMAHQWNGDLVTMAWWDNIWLNESFASWMAAKETDLRNPTWHWWEGQDAAKELAMGADANGSSHPIYVRVDDEVKALDVADPQITYAKGQTVLRMMEERIGPDNFRKGIQQYMKARAYSNATSADLWNALDAASGTDVSGTVSGWTEQAGFPLVTAVASCDAKGARTIRLSQQRFLKNGIDSAHPRWKIPLRIRTDFAVAPHYEMLGDDGQTVPAGRCDEPLSLNADDIGYYRVKYDAETLRNNLAAFSHMPDADRIALLDDGWALTLVGSEPLSDYLALASAMGSHLNATTWTQIDGALERIAYDEYNLPSYPHFEAVARSLVRPAVDSLGWTPKPGEAADVQQLRRVLLGSLGEWDDTEVIHEAQKRFEAFMAARSAISSDDQAFLLSIVAQYADAATFDRMHALAKSASDNTEIRRFYMALMSVRDPALAKQALQIALSSEIPPQVNDLRIFLLGQLAIRHPRLSWDALTSQTELLMAPYVSIADTIYAQVIPQIYWRGIPQNELETWVRGQLPKGLSDSADAGLADAHTHLAERNILVPAMDEYIRHAPNQP